MTCKQNAHFGYVVVLLDMRGLFPLFCLVNCCDDDSVTCITFGFQIYNQRDNRRIFRKSATPNNLGMF